MHNINSNWKKRYRNKLYVTSKLFIDSLGHRIVVLIKNYEIHYIVL